MKLISNVATYSLTRIFAGFINFLSLKIYTSFLPPAEYGFYAIFLTTMLFGYTLFFHWINYGLERFYPKFLENTQDVKKAILTLFLALMGVSFIGIICVNFFCHFEWGILFLFLIFLWEYAWFELNLSLTKATILPRAYGVLLCVKAIFGLGISVLFMKLGYGPLSIIYGQVVAILLVSLFSYSKLWQGFSLSTDSVLQKNILSYSLPLMPYLLSILCGRVFDRLMLDWLGSAELTGLYSASYDLVISSFTLLMLSINSTFQPIILNAFETFGKSISRKFIRDYFDVFLIVILPCTLGFILFSADIATYGLGEKYMETAKKLIPLLTIIAALSSFRIFYLDLSFHIIKKTKYLSWISGVSAVMTLLLNYLLIPKFQILAPVYAGLATTLVSIVLSFVLGGRAFKIPLFSKNTNRIIFINLINLTLFVLLKYVFPGYFIILGIWFAVSYAGLLWATGFWKMFTISAKYRKALKMVR